MLFHQGFFGTFVSCWAANPLCTHSLNWDANSQRSELVVDWHSFTISSMKGFSPISLIKFALTELLSILPSLICEKEQTTTSLCFPTPKIQPNKIWYEIINHTYGFKFFIDARQKAFSGATLLQFMGYERLHIFIGGLFLVLTLGGHFHLFIGHFGSLSWN